MFPEDKQGLINCELLTNSRLSDVREAYSALSYHAGDLTEHAQCYTCQWSQMQRLFKSEARSAGSSVFLAKQLPEQGVSAVG